MSEHFSAPGISPPFCLSPQIIPNIPLQIWEPYLKTISATAGGCLPCYRWYFSSSRALLLLLRGWRGQTRCTGESYGLTAVTGSFWEHLHKRNPAVFLIIHIRESKALSHCVLGWHWCQKSIGFTQVMLPTVNWCNLKRLSRLKILLKTGTYHCRFLLNEKIL